MDPDLLVIFGSLGLTAVVVTAISVVGPRLFGRGDSQRDPERLLESLREDVRATVQDEVAQALEHRDRELEEVHERLEFTERMLTQARLPKHTGDDTTPV